MTKYEKALALWQMMRRRSIPVLTHAAIKLTKVFFNAGFSAVFQQIKASYHEAKLGKSPTAKNSPCDGYTTKHVAISLAASIILTQKCKANFPTPSYPVDVIIPVWNGKEHLEVLLPSLFTGTTCPHKYIFIDDASPDSKLLPWLEEQIAGRNDCVLLRNSTNLGFPATVNKAAAFCEHDFVILNTDTKVPHGWLERLIFPLQNPNVASVTPFSNAATIFSFPVSGDDATNAKFLQFVNADTIDTTCSSIDLSDISADAPCGVGFCMAISHKAWQEVGEFDAATFGVGFGEEVDWCQRAIARGWRHMLMPNLFVEHRHGGSFAYDVKAKRMQDSAKVLNNRYPKFATQVAKQVESGAFDVAREKILIALLKEQYYTLYLTHSLGGGAESYLKNAIKEQHVNGNALVLAYNHAHSTFFLRAYLGDLCFTFDDVDCAIFQTDFFPHIIRVVINELVSWPLVINGLTFAEWIISLAHRTGAGLTILFHDFFPLCPSINLLNNEGIYCCLPDIQHCERCFANNRHVYLTERFRKISIRTWRTQWTQLLSAADDIVFFSDSTHNLTDKIYDLTDLPWRVTPHKITTTFAEKFVRGNIHGPMRIAVVGNICKHKGEHIITELAKILDTQDKIIIIGNFTGLEASNIEVLGRYADPSDLPKLLNKAGITEAFFPSVWPETFSYVTEELMTLQVPLVAFDLGAQGDKVRNYARGRLARNVTAAAALKELTILHKTTWNDA